MPFLLGREVYRRTDYIVLCNGGDAALVAVRKASTEPLFSGPGASAGRAGRVGLDRRAGRRRRQHHGAECAPQRLGTPPETSLRAVKVRSVARTVLRSKMVARALSTYSTSSCCLVCQFTNACALPRPAWNTLIVDDAGPVWVEPREETSPRRTSASGRVPRPSRRTGGAVDRPGGQDPAERPRVGDQRSAWIRNQWSVSRMARARMMVAASWASNRSCCVARSSLVSCSTRLSR